MFYKVVRLFEEINWAVELVPPGLPHSGKIKNYVSLSSKSFLNKETNYFIIYYNYSKEDREKIEYVLKNNNIDFFYYDNILNPRIAVSL